MPYSLYGVICKGEHMLSLGTVGSDDDDDLIILKMIRLLEEHDWDFTYGRDPLLILIEIEESEENE